MRTGYLTDKANVIERSDVSGKAVIAKRTILKNEVVALWGGVIVDEAGLEQLSEEEKGHTIQVHDGFYLAPISMDEPADFINHSCDPNCGIQGQISLVAMRDIQKGEEITFDYSMSDSSAFDEFDCACGTDKCRKRVTKDDWMLPDLRRRYKGYFSSYLEQKIKQI